jgi:adenylate cyclase
MNEERDKRKLSAVLSADVKGYSRLMGEDESGTVRTLKEYREIIGKLIKQYRGRVVDSPGDNLLAEFASVVDAVDGAVEIQKQLKLKNDELPENRRMEFRIGVNLGDVVEDGENIYGDGVNIAARVESLADGAGICISGTAYDQIGKKLPFGYEYLGEQTVKNIEKPVRVYRVSLYLYQSKRIEPASLDKMAFPLPEDPSIAVMPFDNMSGDPKQDSFSDGLSDHIITNLSKVPHLFVIARNSTFTYKGKPVKVQKVAEELGVRYVLEGSVQKTADRIRVTAQLIDAIKGHHLWAESYDRDLKDIFAVQDEITFEILKALQVKLTGGEKLSIIGKGTENLEAYQKILQAMEVVQRFTPEANIQARQLAEEAIALDPKYPVAYRVIAWSHFNEIHGGWSKNPTKSFKRAVQVAQKAVELDDTQAGAHILLGMLNLYRRQYEKAIAAGERAVSISPNGAHYNAFFAVILRYAGRSEESIELTKKAMRLSPIYPAWFLASLGTAYRLTGQYDEAIVALRGCLERDPENVQSYIGLIIAYSQLNRMEEAQALVPEILKRRPNFALKKYAKALFYKDPAEIERILDALSKAGLPD